MSAGRYVVAAYWRRWQVIDQATDRRAAGPFELRARAEQEARRLNVAGSPRPRQLGLFEGVMRR